MPRRTPTKEELINLEHPDTVKCPNCDGEMARMVGSTVYVCCGDPDAARAAFTPRENGCGYREER